VPHGSAPYYHGLEDELPDIDPQTGLILGTHNPFVGPAIRFEPEAPPYSVPGHGG
jgi:hypothetical protein